MTSGKRFMKQFSRTSGSFIVILISIILSILTSTDLLSSGNTSLNTSKIDKNIEKLKQFPWFKELYNHEQHHRSFFVSLKVRKYLESTIRVYLLTRNKKKQEEFILLLEKVAELRIKATLKRTQSK
ncbi:nitrite reductase [Ureibacillus composti]|nr:nitrite reductase [Ureibacillus composti]